MAAGEHAAGRVSPEEKTEPKGRQQMLFFRCVAQESRSSPLVVVVDKKAR